SGAEGRRDGFRIAKRLRCYPVLTIRAVKIAPQHPEAISQGSRIRMEEGLLLDRIALHATYVAPRDVELAVPVETHFADAKLTLGNPAAMSAGKAADESALHRLVEVTLADISIQYLFQTSHTDRTSAKSQRLLFGYPDTLTSFYPF